MSHIFGGPKMPAVPAVPPTPPPAPQLSSTLVQAAGRNVRNAAMTAERGGAGGTVLTSQRGLIDMGNMQNLAKNGVLGAGS